VGNLEGGWTGAFLVLLFRKPWRSSKRVENETDEVLFLTARLVLWK